MSSKEPEESQPAGRLFIVSAPSGAGKTTLVERLVEQTDGLVMSRSYTSRPARPGERNGVDYNFVTRDEFRALIETGAFLEWAEVFGNLYGTAAVDADRLRLAGEDVILVIDVQGARQVRQSGIEATSVFVMPPSFAVLERRLRGRNNDSDESIARRLAVARDEVAAFVDYEFVVVNDELEAAVERLRGIVFAERARLGRMRRTADAIVATFDAREQPARRV